MLRFHPARSSLFNSLYVAPQLSLVLALLMLLWGVLSLWGVHRFAIHFLYAVPVRQGDGFRM